MRRFLLPALLLLPTAALAHPGHLAGTDFRYSACSIL